MSSKKNQVPTWLGALPLLMLVGTAHAQAAATGYDPQQNPAHVSIQAAPGTELEVVSADAPSGSAAITRCTEQCDFWAWPGRYTLYSVDHNSQQRKELPLRVKHSARYLLKPGDDEARTAGLGLGIAGSAGILTGLFMMIPAMMSQICEDTNCTSRGQHDAATAGFVVLIAGVVTTPVGWIMYASNRTRLKHIDDYAQASTESRTQVRVGLVGVGLGGLGLGGVATF